MKLCSLLINAINFEPHCLSPCCDTRALKIPAFPYEGGPIDLQAYGRHISAIIKQLQENGEVCRGCPEIREIDANSLSGMARFSSISINMHRYLCNCKCVYCGLWNHPERGIGYDPLPGLESLRAGDAIAANAFISWGGGEPTILPSFEKAAKWGMEQGLLQHVHTSALKFSPMLGEVVASGMGLVNVSLDSASAETYQKVKGVDGFERVLASLRRYAAIDPQSITLKYIVFEKNNSPAEIHAFLRLCQELGVSRVQYSLNFLEVNAQKVSERSILGAAMLKRLGREMGIGCQPFFIDKPYASRIADAAARLGS